ncbi:agamous-like MADS-box protein MADS2 isoform X2 [Musa acuminata AAA Group]|uniref:agamous-like MADS-box protein MADS2 isoform X2 n=1 Tax=Musa acuminata AAA Group TaxID=214697 RepID=UPI00029621D3|nr:PREDICTED: MADS-box protein CMB1-like [Musa acuminata subsp. malaccensis]
MGRGKVELKRIENKINRQVTFAKRRNGLLKKAYELSILCDAEVAAIVFSSRGRLFEFCSSSSMLKIIERYRRCSHHASESMVPTNDTPTCYQEYLKLKTHVGYLQHSQKNLLGEDLDTLNIKELDQLDDQIEMSLRLIRSTKTQVIIDQLTGLKREEQMLLESNKTLRRKLQEVDAENSIRLPSQIRASNCIDEPPQPEKFFEPLVCHPSLQIGLSQASTDPSGGGTMSLNVNGFDAAWI